MYALPPSPNRPAPVLERSQSRRTPRSNYIVFIIISSRHFNQLLRISTIFVRTIDGEILDDPLPICYPRTEPIRPTRSIPNMPRPSTKRPAPIPPGIVNGVPRRVVSSDRVGPGLQRELVRPHHRGSSVDGLDSSFSESEGLLNERNQVRGRRRWIEMSNKLPQLFILWNIKPQKNNTINNNSRLFCKRAILSCNNPLKFLNTQNVTA